jgi:hypothetical protein
LKFFGSISVAHKHCRYSTINQLLPCLDDDCEKNQGRLDIAIHNSIAAATAKRQIPNNQPNLNKLLVLNNQPNPTKQQSTNQLELNLS